MKLITMTFALLLLVGCGYGPGFESQQILEEVNEGQLEAKGTPQCLVDQADLHIDTKVLGFEIISRQNLNFGFNLIDNFFRLFGVNFKAKKGQMMAVLSVSESHDPTQMVAKTEAKGVAHEREFGFDFSAEQLNGEASYYQRTPLSALSGKTLNDGLKKLSKELKSNNILWKSRIVKSSEETYYYIPAGSVAGLKEGDTFSVYNVESIWESLPCQSKLMMQRKLSKEPAAILKVEQVASHASLLKIVEIINEEVIELGAVVEPLSVKNDLKFAVRVRNIESPHLEMETGESFNIKPYLFDQLEAVMDKYGFYPVK